MRYTAVWRIGRETQRANCVKRSCLIRNFLRLNRLAEQGALM